jgi:hypothetical protein
MNPKGKKIPLITTLKMNRNQKKYLSLFMQDEAFPN